MREHAERREQESRRKEFRRAEDPHFRGDRFDERQPGAGLALLETVSAKMRIFRAPEFLGTAFLLATLCMLTHFLLER